jgi:predicted Zn-dependent peptidase
MIWHKNTKTMKLIPCFLLLLPTGILLTSSISYAQQPVPLPELSTRRLLNDLQVIVASTPGRGDEMSIGWLLRYGSAFDPAAKGGLAYLASQMLGRATVDKTAKNLQEELDFLEATLEVQCDWDGTSILLRGHSSKFERALLLLYQIVGEAEFLQEDLDKVKAERMGQLGKAEDPRQGIRSFFERELFASTTYGRPLRGTADTLKNITLGDVRYFYNRFFSPNEASLVIVGSTSADLIFPKVSRIWGVWVRKEAVPFTFLPPRPPASQTVILQDDPQSPAAQFILGSLWPQRGENVYYTARLAATVLQERLTKALPTSLLTVATEGRRMSGPFYVQAQAAADQAVDQIRKILEVVEAIKGSGCTRQELDSAQAHWIGEFYTRLGTTDGICRALLDSELYRLGINYLGVFDETVHRIDLDAVKQAAKEWFLHDGVLMVVRGPAAALRPGLSSLGGTLREVAP